MYDCFAVHWGDVMFRLTGWNKDDEILYLVLVDTEVMAPQHHLVVLKQTQQADVTKAF